ncbi:MAG: ferrochelatase [Chlorobiaceae bacterium]|jgi:protoporphyrin/coproporphyrin ferrochelatase|nr:ferrochelatase [Chlorobiaceae bacterium]
MVDRIVKRKKYAVVITTYGEVEKLTVTNLWPSSRKILKVVTRQIVRIPAVLIYFIADYRSAKHYINWKLNRYHSSFLAIHRSQTKRVAGYIAESSSPVLADKDIRVIEAYYFVPPYLDIMLEKLKTEYDGIIVMPMIPVESAFSCGVACQMVMDTCKEGTLGTVRVISKMWKDERLHRIYTDYLFRQLDGAIKGIRGGKVGLVLVIHGTLVRDRAGNPPKVFTGLEETEEFFRIMKRKIMETPENIFLDVRQGCINHSRGGQWTEETVEKALEEFKREGYQAVVMFPYGFFADNSETEFDSKGKLDQAGFPLSQYVRCINDSPEFTRWLADRALEEVQALSNLQNAFESLERKP